jgi:hypothetical protein
MPLLKIADRYVDDKPRCLYDFPRSHKPLWEEFWRALDGDYDKILDFAKKGGVENPVEWLEELHRFLFDVFSGCPELVKKASADAFGKFINKIAEQHIKNPREKHWYLERGVLPDDFIDCLKEASKLETPKETILYLNNQIINFGTDLYSEFLLLKTKQSADIKALASKLTKDAYDIELAIVGDAHPVRSHIKLGSKFKHKNCGDVTFECTGTHIRSSTHRINGTKRIVADTKYPVVFCKDDNDAPHAFDDVWNLIPVTAATQVDPGILDFVKRSLEQYTGPLMGVGVPQQGNVITFDQGRDALFNNLNSAYAAQDYNTLINDLSGALQVATRMTNISKNHIKDDTSAAAGDLYKYYGALVSVIPQVINDIKKNIPVMAKLDKNIKQLIEKHKGDNPIFKNFKEGLIHALQQDPIDMKLVKEFAADLKLPLKDLGL